MNAYNKIMLYFWLVVGSFITIAITYLGFTAGFEKWAFYYLFAGLAFFMYFMRRWMMKRMERHLKFLEEQSKGNQSES